MPRLVLIAFRNIVEHRRRSLTLGGAITLVTVLLLLLMGITNGMQSTLFRSATTLISGHVTVGGFYKFSPSSVAPLVTNYREIRTKLENNVDGVDFIIDRMRGFGKIISDSSSQFALIAGIDIDEEKGFKEVLSITRGRLEDLREPDSILIFEEHAKRLGVRVGDALILKTPTFRGVQNTVNVRVVAVAKNVGIISSFMTYVRKDTVRKLYDLTDKSTGAIFVYLKDRNDVPKVMAQIREVLKDHELLEHEKKSLWAKLDTIKREAWTGQRLDVTSWEDEVVNLAALIQGFEAVSMMLVVVLLVIIVIGLMNALWIAIRERTGEIGTLRALGMQRSQVLLMILLEAVMLTLMAAAIGAAIGFGIAAAVNAAGIEVTSKGIQTFLMTDELLLDLNVGSLIDAIVIITTFNGLGALYPAWQAAKIPPVVAMQKG